MTKNRFLKIFSFIACAIFCLTQVLSALPVFAQTGNGQYDVNDDGDVAVSDVSSLLDALAVIDSYDARYDVDNDGVNSVADVSALLDYLAIAHPAAQVFTDTITQDLIDYGDANAYVDWTYTAANSSGVVYAGNSYSVPEDYIQIRSKSNDSGIVSVTSGGAISKVTVVFAATTSNGAKLDVYGSNTPFDGPADLFASSTQGTLLGSIVCGTGTSLEITGSYAYVAVRSYSGAIYMSSITFEWNGGNGSDPGTDPGTDPTVPPVTVSDILTNANTYAGNSTNYKTWTATGESGAEYLGQSAGQDETIQIRSKNNNSGVVVTTSAGTLQSVTVTFHSSTTVGRTVDIYAKDSAYTDPSDLYSASAGTLVASLSYDGETSSYTYTFTTSYAYFGLRSSDGALYLDEIEIVWGSTSQGGDPTPDEPTPDEPTPTPGDTTVSDILTNANTYAGNSTSYKSWTATGESGAEYLGQSAGQDETIQLRSKNNNSGVVVTTSAGTLQSVTVTFHSSTTAGRTVDIYAKDSAYTDPIDLYGADAGTLVASLSYDGSTASYTYTFTDSYAYFGLRSSEGALYLDEIEIVWNSSSQGGDPGDDPTVLTTPEEIVEAAYALGAGETLSRAYTLTGTVTSIDTAYSAKYGNISVYMAVEGMENYPILCYRLKNGSGVPSGAGVEILRVNDTVTVTGILTNYVKNGVSIIEFKADCTLDALDRAPVETVVSENVQYMTLDELADVRGVSYGLPSTGDVEALVIPIGFTNSNYTNVLEKLELGFNGTPEETGWHSLQSYYREVSFGALNIHSTITDIYQTGVAYDLTSGETETDDYAYLADAVAYFENEYDYTDFDANGDGYIDCVFLVYLAPYGTEDTHSDLWWAYTYVYYEENGETLYDGVGIGWYMWFSIEFFDDPILQYYDDNDNWVGDDKGLTVNAETVIHETGHAMGLDDYYDYVNNVYGGLGALNMMDYNQGDHDPYSKAILGWINPTVLKSGDYETSLTSFTTTGDALFLVRTDEDTYFQEFFSISLYTPDGVNALKAGDGVGLYDEACIVIYHVNATLKNDIFDNLAYDICAQNNGQEVDRLIKIVEADGDGSIDDGYYTNTDDVFFEGDSIALYWNDGTFSGWTVTIGEISENGAEISIVG